MNSIQNYKSFFRGLNIASIENNNKLSLQVIDWKTCDKEINEENKYLEEEFQEYQETYN